MRTHMRILKTCIQATRKGRSNSVAILCSSRRHMFENNSSWEFSYYVGFGSTVKYQTVKHYCATHLHHQHTQYEPCMNWHLRRRLAEEKHTAKTKNQRVSQNSRWIRRHPACGRPQAPVYATITSTLHCYIFHELVWRLKLAPLNKRNRLLEKHTTWIQYLYLKTAYLLITLLPVVSETSYLFLQIASWRWEWQEHLLKFKITTDLRLLVKFAVVR